MIFAVSFPYALIFLAEKLEQHNLIPKHDYVPPINIGWIFILVIANAYFWIKLLIENQSSTTLN